MPAGRCPMRSGAPEPTILGHKRPKPTKLVRILRSIEFAAEFALGKLGKTRYTTASGRAGRCWHVCARIPKTRHGRRPFLSGRPHGLLERKETRRVGGCAQGSFRLAGSTSILSKTAGARGETKSFLNGLIAWPAQTGEDRIRARRSLRRVADVVRTSTPRNPPGFGRAGVSMSCCPASFGLVS